MAELFHHYLQLPVLKFNVPKGDPFVEFRDRLEEGIREHRHFIVDRLHLSNFAYNGILGGSVLTPDEWIALDVLLAAEKTFLYWMLDTPHAIEERLRLREGRFDQAEQLNRSSLAAIHLRFQKGFDQSLCFVKGSFMLPQFVNEDGIVSQQFLDNLRVIKATMAGMTY